MVLHNLRQIHSDHIVNVRVSGGKITAIKQESISGRADPLQLRFKDAVVFPGLINSHDHLDFNSFPQLGNNIYPNYTEWGRHIHSIYKREIDQVLKIPVELRTRWGMYKNLLCGITTVVNHGRELAIPDPFITVFQKCNNLHSVGFEKRWKWKLNNPFKKRYPYVIHSGEGTDQASFSEINKLIRWNISRKRLVAVHAVAMKEKQARHFRAIVWCPASNYFLLNKTAAIHDLKPETQIMFGTDSTLTAGWNIWDHIRMARDRTGVTDTRVLEMLTATPSSVWGWADRGKIEVDSRADIVVSGVKNVQGGFSTLNPGDILLVVHQGEIRLFDEELHDQLARTDYDLANFHKISIDGRRKYIYGDLPGLMSTMKTYCQSVEFPVTVPN